MPLPTELFPPPRLVTDPVQRLTYETDAGPDRALPDGVVFVESVEEVARLVAWAAREGVPLVARGAGTGLAGGAVAESGGLVVVTTRMDRISEIDSIGRVAVAEAGAVNLEIDRQVAARGLYFPPDPSSGRSSLIGGNLGTNAGGPHCFKYGVTTNYVQGLQVVLADGEVVELGGRAADYPEYDLAGLVVGSEGTLAIVTTAYLKLWRRPPAVRTLMVAFDSLETAGEAVSAVIATGLVPATLEAIDQAGMRVIEEFCDAGLPVDKGAVLIVELDGYPEGLDADAKAVVACLERHGGSDVRVAGSEEERRRIWHGRKSAAGAMSRLAPDYYLTDVTVRRSRLAAVLAEINRICARNGLRTASFFHAGDGNLHPLLPCDARDAETMGRVGRALDEIVTVCLAEDGSITGEHGVGIEKRPQMSRMYEGAALEAMRQIKEAFDPAAVLNPGKVLPDEIPAPERQPPRLPEEAPFEPASAEEAAAGLRGLAEAGHAVRIGTGPLTDDGTRVVSPRRLAGVVELAPQDLFLTVGAGTPVADLDELLRPHGLLAPVAAPGFNVTVGSLVAANINAPLRMRYGGLRDNVLALRAAMTDGRVLRAGRPLVKNVAGYDLPKVFVGSHGTLGLITEVTLKLAPAPRARRTLALPVAGLGQAVELAHAVLPHALVCSGLAVAPADGGCSVLYTAEGTEAEVEVELAGVGGAWKEAGAGVPSAADGSVSDAWASHLGGAGDREVVVRAAVPPKELPSFLDRITRRSQQRLFIDCAAGTAYAILAAAEPGEIRLQLEELRRPALELGGYAMVTRLPSELREEIDPWGYRPSALAVMRRLKQAWDPAGVLGQAFLR